MEFSFVENSLWPISVEDVVTNLEMQRTRPGADFAIMSSPQWDTAQEIEAALSRVSETPPAASAPSDGAHKASGQAVFRITGVGDHLAATFDVMLMAERALRSVAEVGRFERALLGRFCPRHKGQLHQCRQKCQLLGAGCQDDEADDPISNWLDRIIHPETLDELPFDLSERLESLASTARGDPRLAKADLIVCSHPAMLCILLAQVSRRPLFAHASSTLLYGFPCPATTPRGSTLHICSSRTSQEYLAVTNRLLRGRGADAADGAPSRFALLAEGRFLAEQIRRQVFVQVPWVPPLALYTEVSWRGAQRRSAVVLRSRFFLTLMGELLRSLLREVVAINSLAPEVTFLGVDKQFDTQWLTLEEIASFGAAVLYPNDLHQRTFHEVYKMGMPLFMPDAFGLFRAQRAANWGYSSYGAVLSEDFCEGCKITAWDLPFDPWWNSFNATPEVVTFFQQFADWESLPHVQRFASLPGLLDGLLSADLEELSARMTRLHRRLATNTLQTTSEMLLKILGPA